MTLFIFYNFLIGLSVGALLETMYRSNQAKRFFKPELINIFMYGLVGIFFSLLYLSKVSRVYEIVLLFIVPTLIEFVIGYLYLKIKKVYLWDYSKEKFNFMNLICLRFSIYWFVIALIYYYFFLPTI